MKANFKNIIILVLIIGIVIVSASFIMDKSKDEDKFVYSDLVDLFEKDLVRDFVVDENGTIKLNAYIIVGQNEDGSYNYELNEKGERKVKEYTYTFSYLGYEFQIGKIISIIESGNATNLVEYDFEPAAETPWYVAYLPYIITGILFIGLTVFLMRHSAVIDGITVLFGAQIQVTIYYSRR